jgi:hypothetical protein
MPVRLCIGRLLTSILLAFVLVAAPAASQTVPKPTTRKAAANRANELTLAGLQPGRDTVSRARKLWGGFVQTDANSANEKDQGHWMDSCRKLLLTIDLESGEQVQIIRLSRAGWLPGDCEAVSSPSPWKTGRGLRIGDEAAKVTSLYGEPDSRSPSTKDNQPLELWYYAFDWAGPDVPQVMEVVCTKEAEGKPARVVEITLAAPSL